MSSSEQAPEPTMDEILASIRKIISDDEPVEAPQTEAAAPAPEQPAPVDAVPAEGGLTEDLANALNDTHAGTEDIDDILDLTKIVEDQPLVAEPQMEAPQGDALQAALGNPAEAVAAPAPASEPAPAPQVVQGEPDGAADIDIASLLAEAGVQDTVAGAPAEPQTPAGEDIGAILGQNPELGDESAAQTAEDAPISEALSAMVPQPGEQVADTVPDAAMPESEPMDTPRPAPTAPAEASLDTGVYSPEAAATENPEVSSVTPSQDAPDFSADGGMSAEAPHAAAPDAGRNVENSKPAEAHSTGEDAEAVPADGAGKTLEDSVKEMLRPMLREWIDDNMQRIVQDEVASGNLTGRDS